LRFLGVTETCDLGSLYLRLAAEGHEVRVAISEPLARGTMDGLIPQVECWRSELDWVRAAGDEGIIIFEAVSAGFGKLQDQLRRDGFSVVGGSAFGDRLENDRAFAQTTLRSLGLQVAEVHEFTDVATADAFLAARPGRYVLKFSGADSPARNFVGQLPDGRDVRAVLAANGPIAGRFILMEFLEGVETGVGAYFNGDRFLSPACLDWEHKRFFAGDLGELTGEMGTVATFEGARNFFDRTLAHVEPLLREHNHVGYINLNTIVNDRGIWPLEFTCRFGYPGFSILEPLQDIGWGDLLHGLATGSAPSFPVRPGFSVGIVLTTPPFPYSRKEVSEAVGLPILFPETFGKDDWRHTHFGEVGLRGGQPVTSGLYGWTLVITGTGPTISGAQKEAYDRIGRVTVPNGRYRLDIGDRLAAADYATMTRLGLIG
jgi:phosphoribosylamine--glycine ligase